MDDPRFVEPPHFTEAEAREAFDRGHLAMHRAMKATEHEVTVTVRASEYAGQPFTDDDLLAAVRSTLHEVFPTTSDYPIVPEVFLGNPDLDDEPWVD